MDQKRRSAAPVRDARLRAHWRAESSEVTKTDRRARRRPRARTSRSRVRSAARMDLVYPLSARPVPTFVGLNFQRNDEIRWPIARSSSAVTAASAFYQTCSDRADGAATACHALPRAARRGTPGWAALSRALDYLTDRAGCETVAVSGTHDRKAALSASDHGFAGSRTSRARGAALSKWIYGETVGSPRFPLVCANPPLRRRRPILPVDQHELLALIAPRPSLASAVDDRWADPGRVPGLARRRSRVYRLLGKTAPARPRMPAVDQPIHGTIDITPRRRPHPDYDWRQYRFAVLPGR